MKTLISAVVLSFVVATSASAGVLDTFKSDFKTFVDTFPAHQADGYRDTGCVIDAQKQVVDTNYFNNPTCPDVDGGDYDLPKAVTPPKDDGDNGHGNDDDHDDGSNPGQGHGHDKGKGKGKGYGKK